jgi:hypothetical protein
MAAAVDTAFFQADEGMGKVVGVHLLNNAQCFRLVQWVIFDRLESGLGAHCSG